jgi:hypothetical protein
MSRTAWVFDDPVSGDSWPLPTNPNQDNGSFAINKTLNYTASDVSFYRDAVTGKLQYGLNLIHEGPDAQMTFSFSGRLYNTTDAFIMTIWAFKHYPILLTDDLGRVFKIFILEYQPSRVPRRRNTKMVDYTLSGIVLEELV